MCSLINRMLSAIVGLAVWLAVFVSAIHVLAEIGLRLLVPR